MNKKYLLVFVLGFFVISLFGYMFVSGRIFVDNSSESASVSSLQKGLVGHWTLDGVDYNSNTNRVTDKSAYSNHGTNYGATFTDDRGGLSGVSMNFDGVDDYVRIEDSKSTDEVFGLSDTYTISAWAYADSWANWATIINKANGGSWSNTLNGLWAYTSGYRCVMGSGVGGNPSGSSIGPVYNPGLNEWHHISCVADGNTLKIYVDGIYRGQSSISSLTYPRSDINDPVVIGRRAVSTSPTFDGKIDEIRAYNRALSEKEINLLYDSYKPKVVSGSTQKGLILDMPLSSRYTKSETAGSEIITDRTPSSNDGQNYGATLGSEGASFVSNDWVDLSFGQGINPSTNPHTFSLWVKSNSPASNLMFLSTGQSPNSAYRMYLGTNGGDWEMGIQGSAWGAGITDVTSDWTHITLVMDGSVAKLYINGEFDHQKSYSSYTFNQNIDVGRHADGNYYWNGDISNLRIYDRALSADEVRSLYDKGRF